MESLVQKQIIKFNRKIYKKLVPDLEIIKKFKNRKGSRIWVCKDSEESQERIYVVSKYHGRYRSESIYSSEVSIIPPLSSCLSSTLTILQHDIVARRWFWKEIKKFKYGRLYFSDFLKPSGEIDWLKVKNEQNRLRSL